MVAVESSDNTLNQLTAIDETDDGSDDIIYGYDANGNQISKTQSGTTTTYGWDALNRLTSVGTGGSTVANYVYNGDGLRTRKTVGTTTTDFTWDQTGLGTVIHIADGTVDDDYLWGLGLLGRIDGSGAETYAHSDGLGSIRAISDSSGVEVGTTAYDAFGATRMSTGVNYAFGFTGEQVDAETGFVYLRARYLDLGTGRFISQDPIGLAGGDINLFGYGGQSPINFTDPSGLQSAIPGLDTHGGGGGGGFGEAAAFFAFITGVATIVVLGTDEFIGPMLSDSGSATDRRYAPTAKHKPSGFGTTMDLDDETAQEVLNEGIEARRKVFGCKDGKPYIFHPDNEGGYHGYPAQDGNVIPTSVLREWLHKGLITKPQYKTLSEKVICVIV